MTDEQPTILTTRAVASITVPVDLSSELDSGSLPVMGETYIEVTIDTPAAPRTVVNAITVTLDAALRTIQP